MDRMTEAGLVPLSVLSLDLPVPATGWAGYLADRDISIVLDDLGRASVRRSDARQLFAEFAEGEARKNRMRQEAERRAVEADQQFRASLNPGVPWFVVGRGISPAAAMLEAEQDAQYAGRPRSVAAELLEAELAGESSLVYHSLADEEP